MESSVLKRLLLSVLKLPDQRSVAGGAVQQADSDRELVIRMVDLSVYQGLDLEFPPAEAGSG